MQSYRFPFLLAIFFTAGCAAKPVLYPNAHLKEVGSDQGKRDIAECRQLAKQYVKSQKAQKVALSTVEGGAVGAAMGAVGGAVVGNVGRWASVGGAAGAAGGLVGGLFRTRQPSPVYKNFVDHCMADRGYEVIGWQ